MRSSRWSSLALSALSALALAAPGSARAATLAIGDGGLLLVGADGRGAVRRAVERNVTLGDPSWSPDGMRLVLDGVRQLGNPDEAGALYVVGARRGAPVKLPGSDGLLRPAWSPDGATIAAVRSAANGGREIVALPAAGGVARPLTSGAVDGDPAWSPDGTRLAFTRIEVSGTLAIARLMVAGADGSGARVVAAYASQPAWSPDGTRIAFASTADHNGQTCFEECSDNAELHVIGADGTRERRLTTTKADEGAPAWSPDGRRIAFASDRGSSDAGPEIFAMDADGGCVSQVTWGSSEARTVAWRPGEAVERAPCGAHPAYRLELDLRAARVRGAHALWFGPRFGARRLAAFGAGSLVYAECGGFDVSRCAGNVQVQNYTVCRRNPSMIDLTPTKVLTLRGALVVRYGDRIEVVSGGTTTVVFFATGSPSDAAIARAVAALRPLGDGRRRAGPLPPPRLRRRDVARARPAVRHALETLHATGTASPRCSR